MVKELWELFLTFAKVGVMTFGGGMAMLPILQREIVEKKHWATEDELGDYYAIGQCTPGIIAVNTATFVGYKICGFFGAFAATLGVVLPSFIIISVIALVLRQFEQVQAVQFAFNGIRAGVLALMCKALYSMYRQCPKGALAYAVMAGALVLVAFTDISVLLVIVGCAVTGLIASLIAKGGKRA